MGSSPTWDKIFLHVCAHFGIHGRRGIILPRLRLRGRQLQNRTALQNSHNLSITYIIVLIYLFLFYADSWVCLGGWCLYAKKERLLLKCTTSCEGWFEGTASQLHLSIVTVLQLTASKDIINEHVHANRLFSFSFIFLTMCRLLE